MRTAVLLATCLAFGAGAAQACDQHDNDYSPMSAYFSYRDMSPDERRTADAAARDAMREKDIMAGRAALITRFAIKVERGPDDAQLAQSSRRQAVASR
ncbi:hypothetical protein [Phenylobacterium sp.]|uniref:hypothetical protein n=1 Tax=Phenylobacterium sp. TaxID=1871053 RepID=UPI00272F44F6|nr:hypothetical protein [Phenylobacterium sp.]MDP1875744.1 hypothetical protein [Phenylobacterium sp.]MDP3488983.1 hypothetical protein [Phenylobacterium sp.]